MEAREGVFSAGASWKVMTLNLKRRGEFIEKNGCCLAFVLPYHYQGATHPSDYMEQVMFSNGFRGAFPSFNAMEGDRVMATNNEVFMGKVVSELAAPVGASVLIILTPLETSAFPFCAKDDFVNLQMGK